MKKYLLRLITWLQAASNSPTGIAEPPPPVQNALMDLIGSAATPGPPNAQAEDISGGIIGLIRSIREAKKNAPPKPKREKKRRKRRAERKAIEMVVPPTRSWAWKSLRVLWVI